MNELSRDNRTEEYRDLIHSRILEESCDIAENITEVECHRQEIECYKAVEGGTTYTDEAQDIFNGYQEGIEEQLYSLANSIIKLIPTPTAKTREEQLNELTSEEIVEVYCDVTGHDIEETAEQLENFELSHLELTREIIEIEFQR